MLGQEAPVRIVSGTEGSAAFRASRRGPVEPRSGEPAAAESRALIAVAPAARSERTAATTHRSLSSFLAHLIATRADAPQTRLRRRAEPDDAICAYAATQARKNGHW